MDLDDFFGNSYFSRMLNTPTEAWLSTGREVLSRTDLRLAPAFVEAVLLDPRILIKGPGIGELHYFSSEPTSGRFTPLTPREMVRHITETLAQNPELNRNFLDLLNSGDAETHISALMKYACAEPQFRFYLEAKRAEYMSWQGKLFRVTNEEQALSENFRRLREKTADLPFWARPASGAAAWILQILLELRVPHGKVRREMEKDVYFVKFECPMCFKIGGAGLDLKVMLNGPAYCCFAEGRTWGMHNNDSLKRLLDGLLTAKYFESDENWSYKEYLVANNPRRKLYPWNGDSWLDYYWKDFQLYGPPEYYAQKEPDEASA